MKKPEHEVEALMFTVLVKANDEKKLYGAEASEGTFLKIEYKVRFRNFNVFWIWSLSY